MNKIIEHFSLEEPIHEYFVTICSWCKKELPNRLDIWCGHRPKPGDICPYCGKPLAEEIKDIG